MANISKRNRRREREIRNAAKNRREIIAARLNRRDMIKAGLLTSAGYLIQKKRFECSGSIRRGRQLRQRLRPQMVGWLRRKRNAGKSANHSVCRAFANPANRPIRRIT